MKLIIVHYHLRPGGIRRVIELAAPHIVRASRGKITQVVIAAGEASARRWQEHFVQAVAGANVEFFIEPAFRYFNELHEKPAALRARIRRRVAELLGKSKTETIVWAHNLGLAHNLILAQELSRACERRGITLLSHHHDWWFDNRWQRFGEAQRSGFRSLRAIAEAIFNSPAARHFTINQSDAKILRRHLGKRVHWLPNLTEPAELPAASRVRAARNWLSEKISSDAPVWLLPCRLLRRKNIAEALLLTRWLRPEAWLVTSGGISSLAEQKYAHTLAIAARERGWQLRESVLAGERDHQPTVAELLAASEAVLLTSAQEGFGLPYLEAAAARRPLIARALPNIAPDLEKFGFEFPQSYEEILISPELFNWEAERARQQKLFLNWLSRFPAPFRECAGRPPMLEAMAPHAPVPFSRLTLTAQLEVLTHPVNRSWEACVPLNRFLNEWRRRAARGRLQVTPWPASAEKWLSGRAYAEKFFRAITTPTGVKVFSAADAQADFIRSKLESENVYPLLWQSES